ncbi:hypothetical protein B0T26DRAFT_755846 [Lasiosphaeria miniovina]|uniref:Uncharacterized protein n=1 Tax=Lasiosphaeria miniovina TaxID=1954250 RepID=A0AA39ZZ78_9PEZI|nr:uncharacterized protein B0T26DRAFT_755846 [Lasiosphaeria miniovina]KAK0706332.1 hypothetical protein B0T26DRAFT_755846 [Lasiosphaeria miniovina]
MLPKYGGVESSGDILQSPFKPRTNNSDAGATIKMDLDGLPGQSDAVFERHSRPPPPRQILVTTTITAKSEPKNHSAAVKTPANSSPTTTTTITTTQPRHHQRRPLPPLPSVPLLNLAAPSPALPVRSGLRQHQYDYVARVRQQRNPALAAQHELLARSRRFERQFFAAAATANSPRGKLSLPGTKRPAGASFAGEEEEGRIPRSAVAAVDPRKRPRTSNLRAALRSFLDEVAGEQTQNQTQAQTQRHRSWPEQGQGHGHVEAPRRVNHVNSNITRAASTATAALLPSPMPRPPALPTTTRPATITTNTTTTAITAAATGAPTTPARRKHKRSFAVFLGRSSSRNNVATTAPSENNNNEDRDRDRDSRNRRLGHRRAGARTGPPGSEFGFYGW